MPARRHRTLLTEFLDFLVWTVLGAVVVAVAQQARRLGRWGVQTWADLGHGHGHQFGPLEQHLPQIIAVVTGFLVASYVVLEVTGR